MAHSKMLFVYALLHPMSYASNFYQIKDFVKIILARFFSITFVVCQVKIFQAFAY